MLLVLILAGGLAWFVSSKDSGAYPAGNTSSSTPVVSTTTPIGNVPSGSSSALPYGQVKLHLNQTARFADISVTPTAVVEDSRCPAGVQCIQAGTLRVRLSVHSGMGTSTPIIKLGETVTTEAETIKFVSSDPLKTTTGISPADYVFTFDIEKGKAPTPVSTGGCYVGGCSGQLCTDTQGSISTCEYTASYACYKTARCERQATGRCGWTQTQALKMCLANPPALE